MKKTIGLYLLCLALSACGQSASTSADGEAVQKNSAATSINNKDTSEATLLVWEDLMPVGEDAILAELYSEFYEEMETKMRQQMTLADAARNEDANITDVITEGSAQDTMEQIGTYNVVGLSLIHI